MLCLVRDLVLVNFYMLQYSYVCSSMMSVHPERRGSARYARVSLASVDMVPRLVKCCWILPFPTVCRGSCWRLPMSPSDDARRRQFGTLCTSYPPIRTWRITRARTGLSPPAGYLYKPWERLTSSNT